MTDDIKLALLNISTGMASRGYTPQNKGKYDDMKDSVYTHSTPENVIAVYKELLERFKDVDKREE